MAGTDDGAAGVVCLQDDFNAFYDVFCSKIFQEKGAFANFYSRNHLVPPKNPYRIFINDKPSS